MSAVTGRKRRKRHNARRVGSSTDDDSEHEPIKAGHLGAEEEEEEEEGSPVGDTAPRAEGEEDDDDDEDEEEEEEEEVVESGAKEEVEEEEEVAASPGSCKEEEEAARRLPEEEVQAEAKGRRWRAPEDARSIVSGYSTLSTLGRSLGEEGRGEDADDEHSELVSETDNESGFASRSLTQERPNKHPADSSPSNAAAGSPPSSTPRSFLYSHYKPPVLSPTNLLADSDRSDGGARSSTPSSSSYSSSSQRLHSRPSFNSHKLIQCDTLARKKLKSEKAKARSLDLIELDAAPDAAAGSDGAPRARRSAGSSGSSQERLRPAHPKVAAAPPAAAVVPPSEAASFAPTRSLAEQVRARLLGSADDLRSVGLRKPLSPETRRKRRAWRRHTVVASPTEVSNDKRPPPLAINDFPLSPITNNRDKAREREADGAEVGTRQAPTSRFHQYL